MASVAVWHATTLVMMLWGSSAVNIRLRISQLPEIACQKVGPAPSDLQLTLRHLLTHFLVLDRVVRVVKVQLPKKRVRVQGPFTHVSYTCALGNGSVKDLIQRKGKDDAVHKEDLALSVRHLCKRLPPPTRVDGDGVKCRGVAVAVLPRHTRDIIEFRCDCIAEAPLRCKLLARLLQPHTRRNKTKQCSKPDRANMGGGGGGRNNV
ncbi:hypothetical protein TraAM80_06275 [Trypanosoma rangeli]|uniref:Secreted protein n=1 Tax=Trypanosoma rangeli TaxID=5698 RepID=A0A3R7KW89_TRYRA|nr:uncharacterized protein TraAM80_06275 [Trypanosoma rangeli]RNF02610.1 hypothetical protein TraAM80_06275 [Trypanosoma rangeli]|eukprot:RNF02610.1 hypothetical protein TraAM80_06275 [Trypanosoma rangeli]